MLNNIKNSFHHTNKYIILATPLILFSLLSSIYLAFSAEGGKPIGLLFAVILFFLMLAAFLAGWFNMISESLKNPERENINSLMSEFPAGVGEYILPISGLIINTIILSIIIIITSYIIGMKFIGDFGVSSATLAKAMNSTEELRKLLSSLSDSQLLKLNAWNLLLLGSFAFTYFLMMFYAPAMYFKNKNPFKALFVSFKDLFSTKFFKNIAAFLIGFGIYFIVSILTTLFNTNIFAYFIFTLVNFYFAVFVVVFIFNFYYSNYVKIGSIIDTTV